MGPPAGRWSGYNSAQAPESQLGVLHPVASKIVSEHFAKCKRRSANGNGTDVVPSSALINEPPFNDPASEWKRPCPYEIKWLVLDVHTLWKIHEKLTVVKSMRFEAEVLYAKAVNVLKILRERKNVTFGWSAGECSWETPPRAV